MTAVQMSNVTRRYGSTVALDGVDLTVDRGVTGLLGPNGAGKTTLLRIVATVLGSDGGTVEVLGQPLADAAGRLAVRRQLGYVPQDAGFYTSFTAYAFVDYVAILKEITDPTRRHEEVRRVLDAVGLGDVSRKKIRALSGGMRQRLVVAQSLLGHPSLLVLDEPTSGLDPEQRLRFREVLSTLPTDTAVLLSTHQTEDVAALCDRVAVIDRGRVLFHGTPRDLTSSATGRVWAADEPDPRARLRWRTGDGRYRLIGEPPTDAELVEPTLEDGYLLLVGREDLADDLAA